MKKTKLLLVAAFTVFGLLSVQAQNKNAFKVNLLSPIFRTGSFFYERMVTERSSAQLGVAYTGVSIGDVRFRGIQVIPEYRFYFSGEEGPEGFYLAPFLRYRNFTITETGDLTNAEGKLQQFGGGVCAGYQVLFGSANRVGLDVFLGPSFGSTRVSGTDGNGEAYTVPNAFGGFAVRGGIAIGVAF